MKYRLLALASLTLVLLVYTTYSFLHPKEPEIHYHAGFLVYLDGVKQDFSDFKYMELKPCTDHKNAVKEDPQLEKAHLHDGVGDVVHVEHEGAVWGDLFKNLSYTFPTGEPIVGYVSGEKIDNILAKPIIANESIILVIGDSKNVDLSHPVNLDHIKEVESKSETCGISQ